VKHGETRYRVPVNDFAVPRKELGKQRPIESMEEARDWERLFIGEIKAGRDPRIKPARKEAPANLQTVAGFLDAYFDRHLRPAGIRSLDTAAGRIKVLKRHMGELAVKALEEPALINRFKTESEYSRRVEISTLHKVLAILRAAIRCWLRRSESRPVRRSESGPPEGGSFYVLSSSRSPNVTKRHRLVGMWESRVLCEIPKPLWEAFVDFHRASFPQPLGFARS
jgi:hypothetical protein